MGFNFLFHFLFHSGFMGFWRPWSFSSVLFGQDRGIKSRGIGVFSIEGKWNASAWNGIEWLFDHGRGQREGELGIWHGWWVLVRGCVSLEGEDEDAKQ